jgi:hypothetical protein
MKTIALGIFGVLAAAALFVYSILVGGLIFDRLWYWFLLPVFPTLPHISFLQAVGLSVFTTLFRNHTVDELDDKYKDPSRKYVGVFIP